MMDRTIKTKLDKLNRILLHARKSPFYRERLPTHPVLSLEEFKQIPLTLKEDLRRASPFGLVAVPPEERYQYHESFGTTGEPVSVWLTQEDCAAHVQELANWGVAFNPDDLVLVRFPYSISSIAHMVQAAAQAQGACVVPAGARCSVTPYPRVVNLLGKLEATVLTCLPLQALLIAETAELMGYDPGKDFPRLRAICTAGEPLPPGRRQLLEEIWRVLVFDNYGMTEIGPAVVDCHYAHPHPLEEYFFFEILREDLKHEAPPGEIGYLVITPLCRRGTPIIRYLTGDRARFLDSTCNCGRETTLEIRGRKEDTITIGTKVFDRWDLEEIVSRLPCRRYWAAGPMKDGLHFVIEKEGQQGQDTPLKRSDIEEEFGVKLHFEYVPKGTLYDRTQLLTIDPVGKPRYVYTTSEMATGAYRKRNR